MNPPPLHTQEWVWSSLKRPRRLLLYRAISGLVGLKLTEKNWIRSCHTVQSRTCLHPLKDCHCFSLSMVKYLGRQRKIFPYSYKMRLQCQGLNCPLQTEAPDPGYKSNILNISQYLYNERILFTFFFFFT